MSSEKQVLGRGALNTHFFDGKLKTIKNHIGEELIRASAVDDLTKTCAFHIIRKSLANTDPSALHCLDMIIQTHSKFGRTESTSNHNYDPTNELFACDLLYIIYEKMFIHGETTYFSLLAHQLVEMRSGPCPQGRTTRLFQVLYALKNSK